MNTFKKIGLTALGTSLVASSAIAADFSVSGDAGYTWSAEDVGGAATNDGIGYNHDITISGSGELDNGWSVNTSMILTEDSSLSSSYVKLTMGSMGNIIVGNGYGGQGQAFDDVTPRDYEENHDGMKTTTAIDSIGTLMDNGQIQYNSPSVDLMGASVNFGIGYAPEADDTVVGEGGVSGGASKSYANGQEARVNVSYGGLSAGVYANEVKLDGGIARAYMDQDASDATWFANYTIGPVSFGYQVGGTDRGIAGANNANNSSAKKVTTANGNFEFEKMSIAFNVNESFSISWGELTETYDEQSNVAGGTEIADVDMESTSIQFAYTMGSMSIKGYQTDTDNPGWDSDAKSDEVTELAINFAF